MQTFQPGMDPKEYVRGIERSVDEAFFGGVRAARIGFAVGCVVTYVIAIGLIIMAVELPGFTDAAVLTAIGLMVIGSIFGRYAIHVIVPPDLSLLSSPNRVSAKIASVRAFAPTVEVRSSGFRGSIMRHAVRLELDEPAGVREVTPIGFVPPSAMSRLVPGNKVLVAVDPDDPNRIAIDWATIGAP